MILKIKIIKLSLLMLALTFLHSCKWRVEDKPGYWVITFPLDGATCNEIVTKSNEMWKNLKTCKGMQGDVTKLKKHVKKFQEMQTNEM